MLGGVGRFPKAGACGNATHTFTPHGGAIMATVPGYTRARANGVLKVKTPYLRIPYQLLRSDDFLSLSPYAVKLYLVLLRQWQTHKPDDAIVVSYVKLQKAMKTGSRQISNALKELMVAGYVHKVSGYKACNRYYIEQKRFSGEY